MVRSLLTFFVIRGKLSHLQTLKKKCALSANKQLTLLPWPVLSKCAHELNGIIVSRSKLESDLESVKSELRTCRQNLNEEKSLKLKAEQRVKFLETESSDREEYLMELKNDLSNAHALVQDLKHQVRNDFCRRLKKKIFTMWVHALWRHFSVFM